MAAVDGLVSGIDVTSIVSQLIKVDASTQDRLKANVTSANNEIKGYQSVNTKMKALQTAAEALTKASGWKPTTATSSSANVTATASSTADEGSLQFTVNKLASTKSILAQTQARATDTVDPATMGFPLDVFKDGAKVGSISPSSGTLSEIAAAVNDAKGLGVKAVAVRVSSDQYRLQLTSATSGAAGGFELRKADGTDGEVGRFNTLATAQDAEIGLGIEGLAITSPSNTFADLIPGVTITATKADPTTSITVGSTRDTSKLASSVKAVVDAANAALTEIAAQTKAGVVGSDGKLSGGGALTGDSTLRGLQNQIVGALTGSFGSGASPAAYGLQLGRDGQFTFDTAKFTEAYTADPDKTRALFAPTSTARPAGGGTSTADTRLGLIERFANVASAATKSGTGSLTTAVDGRNSTVKDLTSRISAWDDRLAAKKDYYQKYYSRLETALGSLQNKSTWLAGQLSSL